MDITSQATNRTVTSHDLRRVVPTAGICYRSAMTGFLPNWNLRAVVALAAVYAVALQAVFTTLAPMQMRADGTIAVYCSGSENAAAPDGSPAPATGKLPCVFCGACAGGYADLPSMAFEGVSFSAVPAGFVLSESIVSRVASLARAGPARAPPLSV